MKILHITLSLGGGGAEKFAVSLCNRLAEKGNEVILVSILDSEEPSNVFYLKDLSYRVRFINLHCKSGFKLKAIRGVYETIRRERPDIVHTHFAVPLLLLPALLIKNTRYFHTIHSMPRRITENSGFIKRIIMRYLFKHNKVVPITISETCHQSYFETYKFNNDICITNGSEPLAVTEKKESVKKEIENLKNSPDSIVFIHVARHHPVKNHEKLFRTFSRLEKDGKDFLLLVIGEGYKPFEEQLKESNNIYLFDAKNNVGDYMAQADFFVLSSDYEGLPMTLLEAMSMGVVPISTPAGGTADVLQNGVTGYLSDDYTDESFYRKVRQAIDEKGKIPSERVIEYYKRNYSMESCAGKYYEAYKRALIE